MPHADRDWFVERMGRTAEQDGFPRIAGRLFGYLLLSDQPCSLDELARALHVSKASVSIDARRWLEHGVVERITRPGDRRSYYQLAPDFFRRLMQYRLERWKNSHAAVREAKGRLKPSRRVADRLHYMDAVNEFVVARLHTTLADWDAHVQKRKLR